MENSGEVTKSILDTIVVADQQAVAGAAFYRKLRSRLSRTKAVLQRKPGVTAPVAALIKDLRAFPIAPTEAKPSHVAQLLEDDLKALRLRMEASFATDLRNACEAAKITFKSLQDGFGIGPFRFTADIGKGTGVIDYAKCLIAKDVPLTPTDVAARSAELKAALIDRPVNVSEVASQFDEAMRVAIVRQHKTVKGPMRVELPVLYREMEFIRQTQARTRTGSFCLPRFIVELKVLVQSDQNMRSERQFRLETAVIEHTKDSRKSIFVPTDVMHGYGEGTYFQAIVLHIP